MITVISEQHVHITSGELVICVEVLVNGQVAVYQLVNGAIVAGQIIDVRKVCK